MSPATGLEHVEAAQPTPAPHQVRNTATNIMLPQVWEPCLGALHVRSPSDTSLMLQQGWS